MFTGVIVVTLFWNVVIGYVGVINVVGTVNLGFVVDEASACSRGHSELRIDLSSSGSSIIGSIVGGIIGIGLSAFWHRL